MSAAARAAKADAAPPSRRGRALVIALSLAPGLAPPSLAAGREAQPAVQVHGAAGDTTQAVQRSLEEIVFTPTRGKAGIASARLAGDPAAPGLYVVMVRMEEGARNPPHTHPDGRITTVLRGRILYGVGEVIDRAKARVYGAGSYYYTPPNTPHYLVSLAPDTLYQEVGVGPSASRPVGAE